MHPRYEYPNSKYNKLNAENSEQNKQKTTYDPITQRPPFILLSSNIPMKDLCYCFYLKHSSS